MQTEVPAQPPVETSTPAPTEPVPSPEPTETNEATKKTEKTNAKDSKKPGKKNDKSKGKKDRPPRKRKHVYVENENWKEEVEKTVTLETKEPKERKKEELMKRPVRDELTKKLNKKNNLIAKKRKEIDELYKQKDKIREEERKKNNEGYSLFKSLKEEKEKAWNALEKMRNKIKWKSLREKQTKKRDRLRTLMDKSVFKGIAKNMAQANKHISKLKMEFRDLKKTAKEEKLMTDKISKYEKGLGHFEKVDNIQKQLDEIKVKMDNARKELNPLEKAFKTARYKFNKNNEEFKKKKEEEKEKNGDAPAPEPENKEKGKDKEKKKRVLTEGEQEIVKKVQKVRDAINKLRDEKTALFDDFDKQMVDYRTDHFEFAKANLIRKILRNLKYKERQRKYEEDKVKRQEEELKVLKEARKEIFTEELEKINSVNGALQLLKLDKDRAHMVKNNEKVATGTNELGDIDLESENLQLMVSKKVPQTYKPLSKKTKKRRKKNKETVNVNLAEITKKTNDKSLLPADISVILRDMKVEALTDLAQLDDVIKAVSAKRDEYLQLRERYVNEEVFEGDEAAVVARGESLMSTSGNMRDDGEGEFRDRKKDKKPKKAQMKKLKKEDKADDFPSL